MENLYIFVENGQTVDHPVLESNLLNVYGSIPEGYQPFIRRTVDLANEPWFVKKNPSTVYSFIDGVWTDDQLTIPMNEEEIAKEKIRISTGVQKDLEWRLDLVNQQLQHEWPVAWRLSLEDLKQRLEDFVPPEEPWQYTHQQLAEMIPEPRKFDADGNIIGNMREFV